MKNGWTGGQYSLFRAALGVFLFVHFAALVPWGAEVFSSSGVLPQASSSPLIFLFPNVLGVFDSPAVVSGLLVAGAGLSLLFAAGWQDRVAALGLWYVWASLFGRNPLISNPSLPYVGWMLLAHVFLPPAPYGSLAARGRVDPGGGWEMPQVIFAVAWILMAVGYSFSGFAKLLSPSWMDGSALARVLGNPLARPGAIRDLLLSLPAPLLMIATWGALAAELAFAPLALIPRLRPWIWAVMLGMHLGLMLVIQFAELSLGMALLHSFTFDPGWVKRSTGRGGVLYYDGSCGICHGFVRFILAEDRAEPGLQFAPLDGDAFRAAIPAGRRAELPDSVVIRTADGELLVRSRAVLHVLASLGGLWRVLACVSRACPGVARDRAYDLVARVRKRLAPPPKDACPILPPALRSRFL